MQISENQEFQREPESVHIQNRMGSKFAKSKANSEGDPSVILQIHKNLSQRVSSLKVEFPELDVNLFAPD
ncbi:MAG: hypothetical protein IJ575_06050 [Selenomonadaceae bacterium]|nr:hypothetical protein [Selenomonadaceae bacterium]